MFESNDAILVTVPPCNPVVTKMFWEAFIFWATLHKTEDSAIQSVPSHDEPETLPARLCKYKDNPLPPSSSRTLPVDGILEGFISLGPVARSNETAALWLPDWIPAVIETEQLVDRPALANPGSDDVEIQAVPSLADPEIRICCDRWDIPKLIPSRVKPELPVATRFADESTFTPLLNELKEQLVSFIFTGGVPVVEQLLVQYLRTLRPIVLLPKMCEEIPIKSKEIDWLRVAGCSPLVKAIRKDLW